MNSLFKRAAAKALQSALLPATALAAVSIAGATPTEVNLLELPLAGKRIHRSLVVESSPDQTMVPSQFYSYSLSGTVRGQGGLLGELIPTELPIENVFTKGASFLKGTFKNDGGTNTAVLQKRTLSSKQRLPNGTRVSQKADVKFELVNGVAKVSWTNVRIKFKAPGAPWKNVTGKLKFGQGSKLALAAAPTFQIPNPAASVGTDHASVDIKVTRTGPTNTLVPYTVEYTTVGRTAQPGVDYTQTAGTLTFGPEETEKTITIPIAVGVEPYEGTRDFIIRIHSPARGALVDEDAGQCRVSIAYGNIPS